MTDSKPLSMPATPPSFENIQPYYAQPSDEIELLPLLDKFLDQWRWWVGGAVLGGALGLGAAFVIPPKYAAQGIIQVAQVTAPVESVPQTITRMQTLAFREEVVTRLVKQGLVSEASKDAWVKTLDGKAVFRPVKDANTYVEVNIEAPSQQLSRAVVSTVTDVLKERHQPLMNDRLQQVNKSIELAKANLSELEKQYSGAKAALGNQNSAPVNYLELARLSEAGTLATQRQKLLDLESSKLAPATQPTGLVEPIGVSDRPVSPKKSILTAAGLVLGGMLGTLLSFALPAWWAYRRQQRALGKS